MGLATISKTRTHSHRNGVIQRKRLWTREEYYRLGDLGLIGPEERVELINGEIINKMSPQKSPHYSSILDTGDALQEAFGKGYTVRDQGPMTMDDNSEPEPDVLVALGTRRDFKKRHPRPSETVLVVEVSDTTLAFDRRVKGPLYAGAGIAEYWIIDIKGGRIEVYRDPTPDAGYKSKTVYGETETVTPLGAPHAAIPVSDLLP
jgi:Uma2 family endonuclease